MKKLLSLILTLAMLCTMCIAFGVTTSAEGAPSGNFVTFSSADEFTIFALKKWDGTLYYSTDGTSWEEYSGNTALTAAQIGDTGDYYLCFRGENNSVMSDGSPLSSWMINGSGVSCSGSIENLRDYTGSVLMGEYCYNKMFSNCTALVTAPSLPATSLADHCYESMFSGCTALATAPSLPAENLAFACYSYMFSGCTSLVTAPSLPATILADYCYQFMFANCTSLVTAPSLSAITLANYCCFSMFTNCTGIMLCENESDAGGGATLEWSIPAAANADGVSRWNSDMFSGTGGSFKGAPEIGKTYYYPMQPVERESHDVTGSYQAGSSAETVYSVEITWGSMDFTYTDASQGTWNPETHAYDDATTAAWSCETDTNKITVTNRSNAAINVDFSFTESITGISGGFYDASTGGTAITGNSLALASAAPTGGETTGTEKIGTAFIQITAGALTSGQTDVKIGTITVGVN